MNQLNVQAVRCDHRVPTPLPVEDPPSPGPGPTPEQDPVPDHHPSQG